MHKKINGTSTTVCGLDIVNEEVDFTVYDEIVDCPECLLWIGQKVPSIRRVLLANIADDMLHLIKNDGAWNPSLQDINKLKNLILKTESLTRS